LLHDNQDGTLSERARRRLRQADKSSPQSAIVISRGPANPPDEPVVATTCPTSVLPPQRSGGPAEAGIVGSARQSPSQYEPDSKAGDPSSLWSYIEPHLVKHKGGPIPAKGYVHKLLELPRVRNLEWNPTWLATHPFNDTNPRDISALIIQVTGEHAPNPCGRCRTGKGPFASCVMISAKASSAPLTTVWSCANCFYHFGQTYCTHRDWGKARAERILSARGEGPPPNVQDEAEEEEGDGEGRDLEEVMDVDDNDAMDYTMAGDLPSVNGIPVGIAEAERGRKYNEWPSKTPIYPPCYALDASTDTLLPKPSPERWALCLARCSPPNTRWITLSRAGRGLARCGAAGKHSARAETLASILRYVLHSRIVSMASLTARY